MSRRLHPCLTCPPPDPSVKFPAFRGLTRHRDRVCGICRAEGRATVSKLNGETSINLHLSLDSELRRSDHYPGRGGW